MRFADEQYNLQGTVTRPIQGGKYCTVTRYQNSKKETTEVACASENVLDPLDCSPLHFVFCSAEGIVGCGVCADASGAEGRA